jgi:hypothetical protein
MLLNSVTQLKEHYSSLNQNLSWGSISSFVEQAHDQYILPLLGDEVVEELEAYVAGSETDEATDKLLAKVRRCLTWYAVHDAIPHLMVDLSDGGVKHLSNDETQPGQQWAVYRKQEALVRGADRYAEDVLKFLEKNVSDYPTYWESDTAKANRKYLVNSSTTFLKYVPLVEGRRFYLALAPYIRMAEETILQGIGETLFTQLKEYVAELPAGDEALDKLLEWIEPAVVFMSLKEALPNLDVELSSGGLRFISSSDGISRKDMLTAEERTKRANDFGERGQHYLNVAIEKIRDNAGDYPDFPFVENKSAVESKLHDNNGKRSFMF